MEDQRMKPSHMHSKNYLNKHLRDHHMPFVHGFTESSRDYLTERKSFTEKTGQELRDRSILGQEQVFRMRNHQKHSPFRISFVSTPNPLDHTLLKPIFRHTHQYFRELTLTEDFLAKDSRGIIRVTREIYV